MKLITPGAWVPIYGHLMKPCISLLIIRQAILARGNSFSKLLTWKGFPYYRMRDGL